MNSLNLEALAQPPPEHPLCEPAFPVHLLYLHLAHIDHLELQLDGGRLRQGLSYPGILTIVPAGMRAQWRWDTTVPLLSLELDPHHLRHFAAHECGTTAATFDICDRFIYRDPFLMQTLPELSRELARGQAANPLYVEALENVIVGHVVRTHTTAPVTKIKKSPPLSPQVLQRVLDYIHANLGTPLSLAELATVAALPVSRFRKAFTASVGTPPHVYVLEQRIQCATHLLANRRLSLVEISGQLGFYDQSHFTQTFRRAVGMTPQQFRNLR
jgi:AraC family transcriptional regulator